jgi:hypothetical protein
VSTQELESQIKACNFLKQAGIDSTEQLLNLREEDLEMIYEIGRRLRGDIHYRLYHS